jgi:hypothetical protein
MSDVLDRLIALEGAAVSLAMLRAKDQIGRAVRRIGVVRLSVPAMQVRERVLRRSDTPVARVVDAADLPLATLAGRDRLSLWEGGLRWELRPSFRIDVVERDAGEGPLREVALNFEDATRDLATELEAGFRSALRMRPDPAHDAGIRAQYGVPPVEPGALPDGSVRFAVGHGSAIVRPDGTNALRLTCTETTIVGNRQVASSFEPARGPRYALGTTDVARLAADLRAFFSLRHEDFTPTDPG